MSKFILSLLFLASLKSSFAQTDNPCALLLQDGLYKTFNIVRTADFKQDLKTYFSSDQFKQDMKSGKWGGSLSVIADAVPISIGANASDQEFNTFRQSIVQATSLTINQSFYDYANTRVPDVDLAQKYVDCITADASRFGFKVRANVTEKNVFFVISFYNQVSTDPMRIVKNFYGLGGANIQKAFNTGDRLTNTTTVSSDRDVNKDLIMVLETDRGVATYKVFAEPSGFSKGFPVGTIICSYLKWDEFQVATHNNDNNPNGNLWNPKYSKWAPADGRQVTTDCGFFRACAQTAIPDLRGVFLRGLNSFDPAGETTRVNPVQSDPGGARIRGDFEPDDLKSHTHGLNNIGFRNDNLSKGRDNFNGAEFTTYGAGQALKDINALVTVRSSNEGNSPETRPKNTAIYYYIRIN